MSAAIRVFVNGAPVDVEPGTLVLAAIRAYDPTLESSVAAGAALITDARGIELPPDAALAAGSIVRVIVRARRPAEGVDADA